MTTIVIKRRPEPLYKSGYKYSAYLANGIPLYMAEETLEQLKERIEESMAGKLWHCVVEEAQ